MGRLVSARRRCAAVHRRRRSARQRGRRAEFLPILLSKARGRGHRLVAPSARRNVPLPATHHCRPGSCQGRCDFKSKARLKHTNVHSRDVPIFAGAAMKVG